MKTNFMRIMAAALFALAAPLAAGSALADTGTQEHAEHTASEQSSVAHAAEAAQAEVAQAEAGAAQAANAAMPAPEAPAVADESEEEVRTCRHIRLDASSRRKTRVCRTEQGWIDLNNRR